MRSDIIMGHIYLANNEWGPGKCLSAELKANEGVSKGSWGL